MFNVVYRWLWNASDAQEVTQEAFLKVWKARHRVDATTVEPLLYRTALNLASNRRRSARAYGGGSVSRQQAKCRVPPRLRRRRLRTAHDRERACGPQSRCSPIPAFARSSC